jgi:hypothetical protein
MPVPTGAFGHLKDVCGDGRRRWALDSLQESWLHGMAVFHSRPSPVMPPLFLLRDGSKRRFAVVPDTLDVLPYPDRQQQQVLALLDPVSEKRLLQAQLRPGAVPVSAQRDQRSRRRIARLGVA